MKISKLIDSLHTVLIQFPDAEFELDSCYCCLYIVVDGRQVAHYNVLEDKLSYYKAIATITHVESSNETS